MRSIVLFFVFILILGCFSPKEEIIIPRVESVEKQVVVLQKQEPKKLPEKRVKKAEITYPTFESNIIIEDFKEGKNLNLIGQKVFITGEVYRIEKWTGKEGGWAVVLWSTLEQKNGEGVYCLFENYNDVLILNDVTKNESIKMEGKIKSYNKNWNKIVLINCRIYLIKND